MSTIALLFFPFAMALAASSDLLTMKISNWLVLMLGIGFFAVALVAELSLQQVALNIACGVLVLVVAFVMFAMRWIGGGDAKLAATTAMWFGFGLTLPYLVYASLFGGALTLLILALRRLPLMPILTRFAWLERLHDRKTGIPYGIALAVAGIVTYSGSTIYERLVA